MKRDRRYRWTPERDNELKRLEAAGLSASKIAPLLNTTRNAVLGRSSRLRGKAYKSSTPRLELLRGAGTEKRKRELAHQDTVLAAMRDDLAAGIDRDVLIKRALSAGVRCMVVAEFFGLSRSRVYQIAELGQNSPRPSRALANTDTAQADLFGLGV